jgi:hypothetical protein
MLGIACEKLDADFGVVAIDPEIGDYVVRTLLRDVPDDLPAKNGPFSDPQIGPFGPLQ